MPLGCFAKGSSISPAHLTEISIACPADDTSEEQVECKLQSTSNSTLCLEGGGFRALACDAGLTSGLLAFLAKYEGKQPTLAGSALYDRFGSLSTCSGGSWFAASLIFSSRFATMVEAMSASPETAGQQFKDGWVTPWLSIGAGDTLLLRVFEQIGEELKLLDAEIAVQTLHEVGYFWRSGMTWSNFTETLLSTTAGIDASLPAGAAVLAWAEGKVWNANHSSLTGNGGPVNMWTSLCNGSVGYSANDDNQNPSKVDSKMPSIVPAKFSVTLGAGLHSAAPSKYSAVELPGFRYKGIQTNFPFCCCSPTVLTSCSEAANYDHLEEYAGMLPVSSIVAASSAFLGEIVRYPSVLKVLPSLIDAQFTPWVSQAPEGRAFSEASALVDSLFKKDRVSQQSINSLGSNTVRGVIDAGFTDGTGIAQAVAGGSQEVLSFLNLDSTNGDFDKPIYLEKLFSGGVKFTNDARGQDQIIFPIFAESAAVVQMKYAQFTELKVPSSAKYLAGIKVGSLTATTMDNTWFGIAAGHEVKINVVSIGSPVSIGFGTDFFDYDHLVQEIVDCFISFQNVEAIRREVLPMLFGKNSERHTV
jgi:hypothetical protein